MLVERAEGELPLRLQAELLSLSRASWYYQPRPPSAEEVRLTQRIDAVYTPCPFYGSRKIAAQLRRDQMGIKRKTVARSRQELGIAAISPGPQSLVSGTRRKGCIRIYCATSPARTPSIVGAALLRLFAGHAGWMDLVAILAWFSRYVERLGTRSNLGVALCAHGNATSAGTSGATDLHS